MKIRAIETHYAGCRFRSRLEARWAVFFDTLGIKWVYEPEGYILPNGEWYLPDFWLPQVKMFAEMKPEKFSPAEELRSASLPSPCLMLDGMPERRSYWTAGIGSIEYELFVICLSQDDIHFRRKADLATTMARSARFDGHDAPSIGKPNKRKTAVDPMYEYFKEHEAEITEAHIARSARFGWKD